MRSERYLLRSLTLSPHAVDPLSWFSKPFLPVTLAIGMAVTGAVFVLGTAYDFESVAHQSAAVLCFVLACLAVHRAPRLRLRKFRWWRAAVPLMLSWLGVALSGLGAAGSDGEISRWWAPLGAALVVAALAPFNPAVVLVVAGLLSATVCAVTGVLAFGGDDTWSAVSLVAIAAVTPIQATIAAVLFSVFVVDRALRWSSLPLVGTLSPNRHLNFSQWTSGRDELKLLSDRVVPFIEQVASDGFVSLNDRTVAAGLARELRDELLKTLDRSWLDALPSGHRLRVVDPGLLAGRLTLAQRGAVRSLLTAVLDSTALEPGTLSIELRDSVDGGVAVGLSMRLNLPEGKRMMLLAPYYLTLQATVDDLEWDDRDQLSMRFRIPAPERNED